MYIRKDKFFHKARKEGYRARSSFKLIEIQKKYNLIKSNSSVLDLGCAPGSWLQIIKKYTNGFILGIDIEPIKPVKGVTFIQDDINKIKINKKFDVVLSDIAPKTTGIRNIDQYHSFDLTKQSFEIAKECLVYHGNFIAKTFQSNETQKLVQKMKSFFQTVKVYIPEATRQGSKEVYIIALDYNP